LPEVTGNAALYIDPMRADELADAIRRVLKEPGLAETLINKGKARALQFATEKTAAAVMEQYNNLKKTPASL
jgi:alpha-1,3-rhamnosyl/mannosyltransferase